YHFLVSIAPETKEANLANYKDTIANSGIADYTHKGLLLEIVFNDGSTYEYFGVTKQVYIKMINSNTVNRFAKRSIYPNYTYRMTKRVLETA
ncbi:MAG: KTSC domain-containing protein, partial [Kordia sp.]|uniref:KTSC domain-containing protein n=1 Tax=Kordia sp. TaxID=1965332 RepID=UPI00385B57B6